MKKTVYLAWILVLGLAFLLDSFVVGLIESGRAEIFDQVFVWITSNISQVVIFLLASVVLLFGNKKLKNVILAGISSLIAGTLTYFLKMWIARPRPEISILVDKVGYAFPSGHMTVLFACIPILEKEFPKLKVYFWLFAAVLAFSRLYTGIHYLSDLVAGALVGYFVGKLVVWFVTKRFINLDIK